MQPRLIFMTTIIFWLVMGGLIFRTNRLLLPPVQFRWTRLTQPNATFRWATAPIGTTVTILAQNKRSFKVTVPRQFATGELHIATMPSQGVLTADINAPSGKTPTAGSAPGGGVITLPLVWENIAIQTRTFDVDLTTDAHDVAIQAITLSLTP